MVAFPDAWRYTADGSPVVADNGMVVTTDEYASQVGTDILRAGGNAVDAAIAVQFALAVVNPEAGNMMGMSLAVTVIGAGACIICATANWWHKR